MILLEFGNLILCETLKEQFESATTGGEKPRGVEMRFADFDGVLYHVSTPGEKHIIIVSISWRCFKELKQFGAEQVLAGEYGSYVCPAESGYDFSLKIDLTALPKDEKDRVALAQKVSMLKRNALAAPFHKAFDAQQKGNTSELMQINYRDEEAVWVQAQKDRVTVIFSTTFKDETDVIFGKVFLQEFVDARRQPAIQNSPQVLYYPEDPPVELSSVRGLPTDKEKKKNIGYVTFVLFPRHFDKNTRENSISLIQTFRDYLHYHIKCSKAYMHSRMRARVAALLKILNRAKPDIVVEKTKTASGKTFRKF